MDPAPVFIVGSPPAKTGPLARFLPPLPEGLLATWLAEKVQGTGQAAPWILDPFGASPRLAVEAARLGYRVLVAANNPVTRFLLEMAARPPAERELRLALADLAATFKGQERMEPHIRSLYLSECGQCGQEVTVEAFIWERGGQVPQARLYHCPHCGDSGERPANENDHLRANRFAAGGLHRARALERVAPMDDPDRPHVEEAINTYLPRAVYALFTLINKLESIPLSRRPLVEALLLSACDQANNLWPYPTVRARPRQLSTPPRFRENNVWLALEEAVDQWSAVGAGQPVPLATWPEPPPSTGGLSLFEGRLKDLGEWVRREEQELCFSAVVAAIPRPNQAFWTLSTLWAGWLWGKEAAAPFKMVLRRRRYDWAWHTTALHAALGNLAPLLPAAAPILGLIGETEAGFLSATLVAAALARLQYEGMALRPGSGEAQIAWRSPAPEPVEAQAFQGEPAREAARLAASEHLRQRGEPAGYLYLHTAGLEALARSPLLLQANDDAPAETLGQVQDVFQAVFSYRSGFIRYGGSEHSLDTGLWWLRYDRATVAGSLEQPLSDRIEMAIVRFVQKSPGCTLAEIQSALASQFPGLLTPDPELIQACLDSYAESDSPGSGRWQLRPQESPRQRRADLAEVNRLLTRLGERLGFRARPGEAPLAGAGGDFPTSIVWQAEGGETRYAFYPVASAVLGRVVLSGARSSPQRIIVYPGSRAALLAYKLRLNPRLAQMLTDDWRLVKFRHLRRLLENPGLSRQNLDDLLDLDPVSNKDSQIPLL